MTPAILIVGEPQDRVIQRLCQHLAPRHPAVMLLNTNQIGAEIKIKRHHIDFGDGIPPLAHMRVAAVFNRLLDLKH